ncbi:hypothetical protein B7P43_G15221 [Cryptotermes secundus]|uniref:HAT C-terminal dimerisation domain-containing protein n=1 Tax=Cryptotermes secundus TaxID=105785 RepID=A0A2J7QIR8_9NEOP|nr:hypothetical protein B7P43_G15221 [Cryptotermes secundus]
MYNDLKFLFSDLLEKTIPDWVVHPSEENVVDVDIELQEYLIKLQSDIIDQARLKNDKHLWINSEIANNFPQLCEKVELFFIRIPISYLAEPLFS